MPVPTLCQPLDDLLGGGFDDDTLSEIYGEGGTGKTNLCLQLARNVARSGKKVIYIDTEGLSLDRLRQMCEDMQDFEEVLSNLLIYSPYNLLEQEEMVKKAIKLARGKKDVGLVVVDSATGYYRLELNTCNDVDEKRILSEEAQELLRLSRQENIPCVITSQVYGTGEEGEVRPIGGHALWHTSKTILRIEKAGVGKRKATLMKHRHLPENQSCRFRLTGVGLENRGGHMPGEVFDNALAGDRGRVLGSAYLLSAGALWGASFPIIKYGLNEGLDLGWLMLVRFVLGAVVCMFLLLAVRGFGGLSRALYSKNVWILGVLNGIGFILQYQGQLYTSSTNTSLLINMNVVFVGLLSIVILKDKLNRYVTGSIVLAMAGVFLLTTGGSVGTLGGALKGDVIIILAALVWAFYMIKNKKMMDGGEDAFEVVTGMLLVTAMVAIPYSLYYLTRGGGLAPFPLDAAAVYWMVILYTALGGSIAAFLLYTKGLETVSATASSVFLMFQVVFSVGISYLFLGERLAPLALVGALLICGAILLVSWDTSHTKKRHLATANDK